jgi:hypothetical protein
MKAEKTNLRTNLRVKFIGRSLVVGLGVMGSGLLGWFSLSRISAAAQESQTPSIVLTRAVEPARPS